MSATDLRPLLAAVRRRLWAGHFAAAARHALWGTAALALLLALVHVVWRPVSPAVAALAAAAPWLVALVRAGSQRPADAACALWADRRLGGESAFTTLLEARRGRARTADPRALAWLEHWVAQRLPAALQAMGVQHAAPRLGRPAAAATVCVALAALVLSLPGREAPAGAAAGAGTAGASAPAADATAGTPALDAEPLVSEVARALRSSTPGRDERRGRGDADRGGDGEGAPAASGAAPPAEGDRGDARDRAAAPRGGAPARGDDTAAAQATSATPAGARSDALAVGGSTGREAGTSRDTRTNTGVTAAPQGTMPARRIALASAPGARTAGAQAEAGGEASFDDVAAGGRSPATSTTLAVQPAAPPTARPDQALTPAQTRYVQAWITARGTR